MQVARALLTLDSQAFGLFTLGASAFGSFATVVYNWLQSKFKASEEASKKNEEATKEASKKSEEAIKEASKKSEEAMKEASKKNEEATKAIIDLLKNEHRTSAQDSRVSNYFVVAFSALTSTAAWLRPWS